MKTGAINMCMTTDSLRALAFQLLPHRPQKYIYTCDAPETMCHECNINAISGSCWIKKMYKKKESTFDDVLSYAN